MKILIQHLGSIGVNRQTIDLSKDFYVFVGENNSGKTYVGQLIWTIFNTDLQVRFADSIHLDIAINPLNTTIELNRQLIDHILTQFALFIKKELTTTFNVADDTNQSIILKNLHIEFLYDLEEILPANFISRSNHYFTRSDKQVQIYLQK